MTIFRSADTKINFSDEYAALITELLPESTARGAYFIGIASALAWQAGLEPDRKLLELAARVGHSRSVGMVFDVWRRGK